MQLRKIINILRVDPRTDVDNLVAQDANPLTERLLAAANPADMRAAVVDYLREVYAQCAEAISTERRARVTADLDAAHDRAQMTVAIQELHSSGDALLALGNRLAEVSGQLTAQSQECFRVAVEFGIRLHQEEQARERVAP